MYESIVFIPRSYGGKPSRMGMVVRNGCYRSIRREEGADCRRKLLRLMGESIAIGGEGVNEGVKTLLSAIRGSSRKWANELAMLIGKSVQTVKRYVKTLKDSGEIEFRGTPQNGRYFAKEA